jgi:hypothetical protein
LAVPGVYGVPGAYRLDRAAGDQRPRREAFVDDKQPEGALQRGEVAGADAHGQRLHGGHNDVAGRVAIAVAEARDGQPGQAGLEALAGLVQQHFAGH